MGWLELVISNVIGAGIAVWISRYYAKKSSNELRAETDRLRSQVQDQLLELGKMNAQYNSGRIKVYPDKTFELVRDQGPAGHPGDDLVPGDRLYPGESPFIQEEGEN
jgi:hypothetical protein